MLATMGDWALCAGLGFKLLGRSEMFLWQYGNLVLVPQNSSQGYITPEFSKWPGYLSPTLGIKFADVPTGLAAISKVPIAGWTQMILWGAYCETSQDQSPGTPGAAGDFGWKVLTSDDAEKKKAKLAAELANGRLAMMAIIGMFFQAGLSHACAANVVMTMMTSLTSCELKEEHK